jgi:hypothetical protein
VNGQILGAAIAICKSIPSSAANVATQAANSATEAAERAETAAELAETHNMGVTVTGKVLTFSKNS